MPLRKGRSRATISRNIREMHHGKRYAKVKRRHGAKVAHRMAVAAAYSAARRGKRR